MSRYSVTFLQIGLPIVDLSILLSWRREFKKSLLLDIDIPRYTKIKLRKP